MTFQDQNKNLINIFWCPVMLLVLFDVTTLKIVRKPVKLQKENPAGCVGIKGDKSSTIRRTTKVLIPLRTVELLGMSIEGLSI